MFSGNLCTSIICSSAKYLMSLLAETFEYVSSLPAVSSMGTVASDMLCVYYSTMYSTVLYNVSELDV